MKIYIVLYRNLQYTFHYSLSMDENYESGTRFYKCTENTTVANLIEWLNENYESTSNIVQIKENSK